MALGALSIAAGAVWLLAERPALASTGARALVAPALMGGGAAGVITTGRF